MALGCGSADTGRPGRFDPNDLPQTLRWLKNTYEPVESVPALEQNPLAKKEASEKERAKFAEQMRGIKGTTVRWSIGVENLTVDGFQPKWLVQQPSGGGTACGRLKMYREDEPKVETKGLIFKETVDHVIRVFEVNRDITAELYKKLTPTGKVVIEGNVFDIDGFWMKPDSIFDIVLVKIRIVDVLP
jgi:hypothetical protein